MVSSYVEIVVGVKLTDREACKLLLGMADEEYDDLRSSEDLEGCAIFSDKNTGEYETSLNDFQVFTCICCSDTTDIVIGVSLRKLYRIKTRCDDCDEYNLCDNCFGTTEQGYVSYKDTYSFAEVCPPEHVCGFCESYNPEQDKICKICKRDLKPFDTKWINKRMQKLLEMSNIEYKQRFPDGVKIYFHWNDCGSCS